MEGAAMIVVYILASIGVLASTVLVMRYDAGA